MKRSVSLALVLAMLVLCFSGCKKNETTSADSEMLYTSDLGYVTMEGDAAGTEGNSGSGNNAGGTSQTTSTPITTDHTGDDGYYLNDLNNTGKSATLKNNCYSTGYPIADKTITFNVMIKDYTNLSNYDLMKINDFLKEKMNVQIKWNVVQANDVIDKMTLAFASGNMPDLFWGMAPFGTSSIYTYAEQGLVLKLDDYIDKYAPNIKRMFSETPESKYAVTYEDGNIYSIPMVNSEREAFAYEGLYINKTWLDKLNLGMPTSTNSFLSVLSAFKSNDPNGNGKADEIPLCLINENMSGVLPACLYGPFGISAYGSHVGMSVNDSGKIVANFISDNYKTALTYYKTLYKKGLIDSEWFSNNKNTLKTKLNTGTMTVGAFVSENPLLLMDSDRFSNYTLVPAFRDKSVSKASWSITGVEYIWSEWVMISSSCKKPEVAMRLIDYFYSLEGSLTALLGPQGNNWDVKSDGSIYMTDAYYAGTYKNSTLTPGYPLPNYASKAYYALTDKTTSSKTVAATKATDQAKKDIQTTYKSAAPKNVMPNLIKFTSDEDKSKVVSDQLTTYIQSMAKEFVSGSTDISAFWDNYVSVCKNLGCDNSVYYAQLAYDRYKKAVK